MKSRMYSKQSLLMENKSYDYNNDGICGNNCGGAGVYDEMGSFSSKSSSSLPGRKTRKGKKKKKGRKRYNDETEVDNGCCGAYSSACQSACHDKTQGPLAMIGGILLVVLLIL